MNKVALRVHRHLKQIKCFPILSFLKEPADSLSHQLIKAEKYQMHSFPGIHFTKCIHFTKLLLSNYTQDYI